MHRLAIAMLGLLVVGCSAVMRRGEDAAPRVQSAQAQLRDADGRAVGDVRLDQLPEGVLITAQLTNMPPGAHAVHLHAVGRCEPTFEAAGGHFDPAGREHGFENPRGPHAGDLPNLYVAESGTLRVEMVAPRLSLGGQPPLLDDDGAAVVVHAFTDDYETNPSGNSGARIACGVIQR